MKKRISILAALELSIILNILAIATYGAFHVSNATYTIMTGAAFAIQSVVLAYSLIQNKAFSKYGRRYLPLAISMIVFAASIIAFNLINWGTIDKLELVSLASSLINIIFLIVLAPRLSIGREELAHFYKTIIIIGLISAVFNIVANIGNIVDIFTPNKSYEINLGSFFPNRNPYGMFMLICIISLEQYSLITKMPSWKRLTILSTFLLMAGLTFSRTSIIGILTFLAVYASMSTGIITKKRLAAMLLAIITIAVSAIAIIGFNNAAGMLDRVLIRADTIGTFSGRTAVWKNGIEIGLRYNPLTGVGRQKPIEINNTIYHNKLTHFHSTYIQILAMYGVVGLVLFIYLLFLTIIKICTAKIPRQFRATMLAATAAFMIISIFESVTRFSIGYADITGIIFYFTIPLLITNNERIFTEDEPAKTHRRISPDRRAKE